MGLCATSPWLPVWGQCTQRHVCSHVLLCVLMIHRTGGPLGPTPAGPGSLGTVVTAEGRGLRFTQIRRSFVCNSPKRGAAGMPSGRRPPGRIPAAICGRASTNCTVPAGTRKRRGQPWSFYEATVSRPQNQAKTKAATTWRPSSFVSRDTKPLTDTSRLGSGTCRRGHAS